MLDHVSDKVFLQARNRREVETKGVMHWQKMCPHVSPVTVNGRQGRHKQKGLCIFMRNSTHTQPDSRCDVSNTHGAAVLPGTIEGSLKVLAMKLHSAHRPRFIANAARGPGKTFLN